ncbi:MAG: SPOR domain-containing protein [bacterium]
MKLLRSTCSMMLVGMVIAWVAWSCRGPEGDHGPGDESAVTIPEDLRFDPLEMPADREVVPAAHPRSGQVGVPAGGSDVVPKPGSAAAADAAGLLDTAGLHGQIFRVQLLATQLYGEAQQTRRTAEEIFDRPVHVDYEVPYFKVRVGDFADRDEAEEYLMTAKSAGYSKAWVAMVNIAPQKAPPLYDSSLTPGKDNGAAGGW